MRNDVCMKCTWIKEDNINGMKQKALVVSYQDLF